MKEILKITVLVFTLLFCSTDARVRPIGLPKSLLECFQRYSQNPYTKQYPVEQQSLICLQRFTWMESKTPCKKMSSTELNYLKSLFNKSKNHRKKRATQNKRKRKEYRSLTEEERKVFHDAVRALKAKSTSNYETIANYHQANAGQSAHGGPNFPGWHRVFLLIYEEALIEASNGKLSGLPYVDWRLDYRLSSPGSSILWTHEYLGNGDGRVRNGPFENWVINRTTLVRNVGTTQRDPTNEDSVAELFAITSARSFADQLENVHNIGHIYVGGLMNSLSFATYDPVFFMHHCWIDYLWWRYQCPNGRCRDDRFVYPGTNRDGDHAPTEPMDNLVYKGELLTKDGYDRRWLDNVEYEISPADCNENCNSRYATKGLNCVSSRCLSATSGNFSPFEKRKKRSANRRNRHFRKRKREVLSYPVQNIFRVDCESDTTLWGYMPVKVVYVRCTDEQVYNSFTVKNGTVLSSTAYDFYDNRPEIQKIDRLTVTGHPSHFKNCKADESGAFKINVNSYGLNYRGNYEEYAIVDDRIPLSSAMAYIAVKRPTKHRSSKVYLTAFDGCGRYCTPECLVPGSKPPRYEPCTGAMEIDVKRPKGYANTFDDAVLMYFNFRKPGSLPTFNERNVPIVFYCKRNEKWIPAP